jgi:hypothetical protein
MVCYTCSICNKQFKKKCNYDYHVINKKKPCKPCNIITCEENIEQSPKTANESSKTANIYELIIKNDIDAKNDILDNKKDMLDNKNIILCSHCNKTFTRLDSLQKHLNGRCKTKKKCDEIDILKEKIKTIEINFKILENKYQKILNNQKEENDNKDEPHILNNIKNIKNDNKQINNGIILNNNVNNNVNIKIVQFGNEDISKLNLTEAMKTYFKSSGGNIVSNMLKFMNLNEDYPENNNICITDLSREIVKIHNGKRFIYKKFKNVKGDILNKVVNNTRKIINNYENNEKIKKSIDIKNKLKINNASLKLIDGITAEDIVREEINENEQHLIKNKNDSDDEDSIIEREFTLDERMRIANLEKKRDGMQKRTYELIKDDLYNGKVLVTTIEENI